MAEPLEDDEDEEEKEEQEDKNEEDGEEEINTRKKIKGKKIKEKKPKKVRPHGPDSFDKSLNPRTDIPKIEKNPLLEKVGGKREYSNKGCCIFCNNREAIQCAAHEDEAGLKSLIRNNDDISNIFQDFAVDTKVNALDVALRTGNKKIVSLLAEELVRIVDGKSERAAYPTISLMKKGTGKQNRYQFGFAMRQVKMSRVL